VPSAKRATYRVAAMAALVLLLALAASGCETTQDKAAAKQAESKRILEKREEKRHRKHHAKSGKKGAKKQ
jgi:F420-dependent methylenetetrahydromethanopterin dehydrogenase